MTTEKSESLAEGSAGDAKSLRKIHPPVISKSSKYIMLDFTVTLLSLGGIILERKGDSVEINDTVHETESFSRSSRDGERKTENDDASHDDTITSYSAIDKSIQLSEPPVFAVISTSKNTSNSDIAIATHIPSLPLGRPSSSYGDKNFHYEVSFEKDGLSTFKFSRVLSSDNVSGQQKNHSIFESIKLGVSLMRGNHMIKLGEATLDLTGEEEDTQIILPVSTEFKKERQKGKKVINAGKKLKKSFSPFKKKLKGPKQFYFPTHPNDRFSLMEEGIPLLRLHVNSMQRASPKDFSVTSVSEGITIDPTAESSRSTIDSIHSPSTIATEPTDMTNLPSSNANMDMNNSSDKEPNKTEESPPNQENSDQLITSITTSEAEQRLKDNDFQGGKLCLSFGKNHRLHGRCNHNLLSLSTNLPDPRNTALSTEQYLNSLQVNEKELPMLRSKSLADTLISPQSSQESLSLTRSLIGEENELHLYQDENKPQEQISSRKERSRGRKLTPGRVRSTEKRNIKPLSVISERNLSSRSKTSNYASTELPFHSVESTKMKLNALKMNPLVDSDVDESSESETHTTITTISNHSLSSKTFNNLSNGIPDYSVEHQTRMKPNSHKMNSLADTDVDESSESETRTTDTVTLKKQFTYNSISFEEIQGESFCDETFEGTTSYVSDRSVISEKVSSESSIFYFSDDDDDGASCDESSTESSFLKEVVDARRKLQKYAIKLGVQPEALL